MNAEGVGDAVEALTPRAVSRASLRNDLICAAQLAIGEKLRTNFQTPYHLPSPLRTRIDQLALRYG
jgi:hypothetical protein